MTTYRIQAPDGKTYQIDGPEGASQEDVQNEVMRQNPHLGGAPSPGGVAAIPVEPGANTQITPDAPTTFGDKVRGAIETPFALAANLVTAPISYLSGALGPKNQQAISNEITYQPRTQVARDALGAVGSALEASKLPPFIPSIAGANMLAQSTKPATRAIKDNVRAVAATDIPFGATTAQQIAGKVLESGNEAATLDNLALARSRGIVVNPNTTNPTPTNKIGAALVGDSDLNRGAFIRNRPVVNSLVREDLRVPEGKPLNKATYDGVKQGFIDVTKEVESVPKFTTDAQYLDSLNNKSFLSSLPEAEQALLKNSTKVTDLIEKAALPEISGRGAVALMRQFRAESSSVLNNPTAKPSAVALANAQRNIAKQIESMIERRLTAEGNADLAKRFVDQRTQYAKVKAYEKVTTPNGDVQAHKLNKAKNAESFTGNLADLSTLGKAFPDVFTPPPTSGAGLNLTLGGRLNTALDIASTPVKKWMLSEGYQAKRAAPKDYRGTAFERPVNPSNTQNLPAVFDPANAVTGAAPAAPAGPNWTIPPRAPDVTATGVPPSRFPQLPAPSAESTLAGVQQRRGFDYRMAQAMDQPPPAAPRVPTGRGTLFDLDPITGRLREASAGVKGATPEIWQANLGAHLASAAKKVAEGREFALTAAEKVAWKKTPVELQRVIVYRVKTTPGMLTGAQQ